MCRSFMYSRIWHLLYCQDELADLQNRLLKRDKEDASTVGGVSRREYENRHEGFPRKAVMNKLGQKLKEYGGRCRFISRGH